MHTFKQCIYIYRYMCVFDQNMENRCIAGLQAVMVPPSPPLLVPLLHFQFHPTMRPPPVGEVQPPTHHPRKKQDKRSQNIYSSPKSLYNCMYIVYIYVSTKRNSFHKKLMMKFTWWNTQNRPGQVLPIHPFGCTMPPLGTRSRLSQFLSIEEFCFPIFSDRKARQTTCQTFAVKSHPHTRLRWYPLRQQYV